MKICLVTDTFDNVNGVVTTIKNTIHELQNRGHIVFVIHPGLFLNIPMPGYKEIKISLNAFKMSGMLNTFKPDAIHICTEGPLGLFARQYCMRKKYTFTTSFHTKFPEFVEEIYGIDQKFVWSILRWFHSKSKSVLVTTNSHKNELFDHGFQNLVVWGRGVDIEIFKPFKSTNLYPTDKPNLLCVSRLSKEKGLDTFCQLDASQYNLHLVGDGPYRLELETKYPYVNFYGYKHGQELASFYQEADCFVFPSVNDTFGVVMLESIACGTPVAAFPVTGPIDVIDGINGVLNPDLAIAIEECLKLDRNAVSECIAKWSWKHSTDIFENELFSPSVMK